jgi:2-polyprenyl-3-methyl-5-hydroxy-6-metoxy-1,4-benzoquinol methylase
VTLGLFFLHQLLLLRQTSTDTEGDLPQNEIHTNGRKQLRILRKEEDFARVTPHLCRDTRPLFHGVVAKICIRSPTEMISGEIAKTGSWDNELVLLVMKAMFAYPEATLLDLGSNIGMFTVAVAAMGRKVKAVDAGFENHAYTRTSLQLTSNLHHVDLIVPLVSLCSTCQREKV